MCNWVTNRLTLISDNLESIILNHTNVDKYDELQFDFNTIVPMPNELNIDRSSTTIDGFMLYIAKKNPLIVIFGDKEDKLSMEDFSKLMIDNFGVDPLNNISKYILKNSEVIALLNKYGDKIEEILKIGETAFNNKIKYGATDWYEWRIKNWGCKWNACNTIFSEGYTQIFFDTPWSPPIPVIEAFAKLHPEVEIIFEFAEEQTGYYSGRYKYKDGVLVESTNFEEYSKEAYEMSFELWGNEESYKYNEEIDNYEYIEETNELSK